MRVVVVVALVVAVAACSTGQRLTVIERRLTHLEDTQQDRKAQLDAIEARLEVLTRLLEAINEVSEVAELAAQLDELAAAVDELGAKVATRPTTTKRRPEPDPADVYAVGVTGSASDGPADALVTIVRAYEYACPFCEKSRATMAELRRRYPKDVRIVYRSFIVHPQVATLPAEAACAAHRQGLFREADDKLWAEAFAQRKFDQAEMERIAAEIGADVDLFRADMSGPCVTQVGTDLAELRNLGVGATPTFFINGRYLSGAQPLDKFVARVDEELALARGRLGKQASRKARKTYYDTWVIAKGKPKFVPVLPP